METLVIQIKDKKKSKFVKELLGSFDFISIEKAKGDRKKAVKKRMAELKEAFNDIKLAEAGKKKLKTLDEVLNEL